MPKRRKVCFSLDADYRAMARAMASLDGWHGSLSDYCAHRLRQALASDIADFAGPPLPEIQVSPRVLRRAKEGASA